MEISAPESCATLTIDLGALAANWSLLQSMSAPAECAAVVKADAYGCGIERVVPALARAGCRTFFVAHASEGRRVRQALGEDLPGYRIYVLNGLPPGDRDGKALTSSGLRPVLSSLDQVRQWRACSEGCGVGLPAALQVDTGMNRLGISIGETAAVRAQIAPQPYDPGLELPRGGNIVRIALATEPATLAAARSKPGSNSSVQTMPPGVYLDLVMSHFVSAERPLDPLNWRQTTDFRKIAKEFPGVQASLANSSGIFLAQRPHFDLVRPGFALYGGNPVPGQTNPMRPVVRLQAAVLQVREVRTGETAGYNSLWTAKRDSRLATVGIGYGDGFPRGAGLTDDRSGPGAEAILAGQRCPFVGRTSMDLTILDVSDVPADCLATGTLVEILGRETEIDELAARSGTIGYEILTSLGQRYERVYLQRQMF